MATACSKWERIGQPAVVSETTTSTRPLVLDLDRAHHAQLDDRAAQLGVDHGAQLLGYLILRRKWHRGHSRKARRRGSAGSGHPPQGGEIAPLRPWPSNAVERRRSHVGDARAGCGRIVAMGIALALALLLLAAREATAGKYAVAQCGWYVGADADWADTTGGAKFRPDAYCVTPAGADPFDGAHLKSFTRDGQRPSPAPASPAGAGRRRPGPASPGSRGTWWHALHDGIEQRIGVGNWGGGFDAFAGAGEHRRHPARLRRRLLAAAAGARGPPALRPGGEQVVQPRPGLLVGAAGADDHGRGRLRAGAGDRRRPDRRRLAARRRRACSFWGTDVGGGVRFGETLLDGARVALTEYPCAKALIGGEWRATRMRPCRPASPAAQTIDTTTLQRRPAQPRPLRHRLRRQRRLPAASARS